MNKDFEEFFNLLDREFDSCYELWREQKFTLRDVQDIFKQVYIKLSEQETITKVEMNEYDVKRLAFVLAIQAEIEGMKTANIERENAGYALAYDEKAFTEVAEELRMLATKHNK